MQYYSMTKLVQGTDAHHTAMSPVNLCYTFSQEKH